jgi:hypothetical protein
MMISRGSAREYICDKSVREQVFQFNKMRNQGWFRKVAPKGSSRERSAPSFSAKV